MTLRRRVSIFVLARLVQPKAPVPLFLMDGNERAKPRGGGYAAGARKLLELARYLRDAPRVEAAVACVLSKDNVTKRSQEFFSELHEALVEFGAEVTSGALESVRIELAGSLARLRERGGHAAICGDTFEALERATAHETSPALRLLLAIDYGASIALSTGANLIVRTGMQAAGVARSSGIDVTPEQRWYATPALWPELDLGDVAEALERFRRRPFLAFTPGYEAQDIKAIVEAMASAIDLPPVHVTLQTLASATDVCGTLEQLHNQITSVSRPVTAIYVGEKGQIRRHYGGPSRKGHVVRLFDHRRPIPDRAPYGYDVIVAPGQEADMLTLPARPRPSYATVWTSAADAESIVMAMARGAWDLALNPPLYGASRAPQPKPHEEARGAPEEGWVLRYAPLARFVEQRGDCSLSELVAASPEELREGISSAEVFRRFFVAKLVRWAAVTKVCENLDSCPGALNYILTSYALFPDAATAELVARYMILVAVGDVLFDGVLDDESAEAHRCRVSVSALYLRDSAGKSCIPGPPPAVSGAQTLQVIAEQWAEMYRKLSPLSEASLLKRWVSALSAHYVSSVREYEIASTENDLVRDLVKGGALAERAAHAIRLRYPPVAPRPIAERILHLAERCVNNPARASLVSLELKVLLYLVDVNTIGAGLAFRTAALTTPRQSVSCEHVDALEGTLPVLDARVRLANDLSGFIAAQGRDRDRNKTNSCALLVPVSATGVEREAAIMRAVGAVRRVSCWLDGVLDQAISRLISVWPTMGAAVRRGRQIGVTAYEIGHYTTLSAEEMAEALRQGIRPMPGVDSQIN